MPNDSDCTMPSVNALTAIGEFYRDYYSTTTEMGHQALNVTIITIFTRLFINLDSFHTTLILTHMKLLVLTHNMIILQQTMQQKCFAINASNMTVTVKLLIKAPPASIRTNASDPRLVLETRLILETRLLLKHDQLLPH